MGFLAFEQKEEDGVTMKICNPILQGVLMDCTLGIEMASLRWLSDSICMYVACGDVADCVSAEKNH